MNKIILTNGIYMGISGFGCYLWDSGQFYIGEFCKNKKISGEGFLFMTDGSYFHGFFDIENNEMDSKAEGQGLLKTNDGKTILGYWKNGIIEGESFICYPDENEYYICRFQNGVMLQNVKKMVEMPESLPNNDDICTNVKNISNFKLIIEKYRKNNDLFFDYKEFDDGGLYLGCINNKGLSDGLGLFMYNDQKTHCGIYNNGILEGACYINFENEEKFIGKIKNEKMEGKSIIFKNKQWKITNFKEGKANSNVFLNTNEIENEIKKILIDKIKENTFDQENVYIPYNLFKKVDFLDKNELNSLSCKDWKLSPIKSREIHIYSRILSEKQEINPKIEDSKHQIDSILDSSQQNAEPKEIDLSGISKDKLNKNENPYKNDQIIELNPHNHCIQNLEYNTPTLYNPIRKSATITENNNDKLIELPEKNNLNEINDRNYTNYNQDNNNQVNINDPEKNVEKNKNISINSNDSNSNNNKTNKHQKSLSMKEKSKTVVFAKTNTIKTDLIYEEKNLNESNSYSPVKHNDKKIETEKKKSIKTHKISENNEIKKIQDHELHDNSEISVKKELSFSPDRINNKSIAVSSREKSKTFADKKTNKGHSHVFSGNFLKESTPSPKKRFNSENFDIKTEKKEGKIGFTENKLEQIQEKAKENIEFFTNEEIDIKTEKKNKTNKKENHFDIDEKIEALLESNEQKDFFTPQTQRINKKILELISKKENFQKIDFNLLNEQYDSLENCYKCYGIQRSDLLKLIIKNFKNELSIRFPQIPDNENSYLIQKFNTNSNIPIFFKISLNN